MTDFSPIIWLLLAGVAAAAITAVLYCFACRVRDEVAIHDLRVDARRLRDEYMRRIAELRGDKSAGAAELDEPTPVSAPSAPAPAADPAPAPAQPAPSATTQPAPMKQAA